MNKSFKALGLGAGILTVTAAIAAAQTLVIATDRQGSLMNRVGTAMAKTITDNSDLRAVVRPFAGPDAYLSSVNRGQIKLAVLTASSVYLEVTGNNKSKKRHTNFRILRSGPNVLRLGFIVRKDSKIKTIADLKGHKLTSGFGGHSVLPQSIATGLANGGIGWDDVVKVPVTGVVDGVKSFGAGRTDASWGALGMPAIREIHAQRPVRFLSFENTPETLAKMRKMMFPGMQLIKIGRAIPPLSVFGPVNLITYDTYLMANKDLDDATAAKIVSALWKGTDSFIKSSPIFRGFKQKSAVTHLPMTPYHRAAIKFYKGHGLWTDKAIAGNKNAENLAK